MAEINKTEDFTDIENIPRGMAKELTDKEKLEIQKAQKTQKEKAVVNRVIAGHNDVFEKQYDFDELDLHFKVKIKFPNILEQARIQANVERYFEGTASLISPEILLAYRMFATLRICSKPEDVPDFLSDDEHIYNLYIFNVISGDFKKWMDSFHY